MKRTISVVLFSIFIMGLTTLFLLGYLYGDVDDNWVLYFSIGGAVGGILGYFLRHKSINMRVGKIFLFVFFLIGLLLLEIGIHGAITNRRLFSGKKYEEMDGLIPYLQILSSLIPLGIGGIILLFLKSSHKRAEYD